MRNLTSLTFWTTLFLRWTFWFFFCSYWSFPKFMIRTTGGLLDIRSYQFFVPILCVFGFGMAFFTLGIKERVAAGLYETTLTCEWEGGLEGLVKFLYEQQGQGVASDIRVLRVQVASGKEPGKLKGGFEMDCAYRRESRAE